MGYDWKNLPGVNFQLPYVDGTQQGHTVQAYALDWTYRFIFLNGKAETRDQIPSKTFYMRMPDGSFLYGNIKRKPARRM